MSSSKMILLMSSDGEAFEIEEVAAMESQTIKLMIEEDNWGDSTIPLPNVTSKILSKVTEYCKQHAAASNPSGNDENPSDSEDELKKFDAEFLNVDQGTLFELILAANYLKIKSLLNLTCKALADLIKVQKS